jgi:hypothetical protein
MSTRHISVLAAAVAILAAGCTSQGSLHAPREYLDPSTAATVSVVAKPLVFYREHPELAVHMRDYVTVAAAAVDRQGKTDYVLIAYFWTTLDAHGRSTERSSRGSPASGQSEMASPERLVLLADDRYIALDLVSHSARDIGIGERVHAPPDRAVMPAVYRTDLPTLRFLAAARHLDLMSGANDSDSRYELWDYERPALSVFVRQVNGDP